MKDSNQTQRFNGRPDWPDRQPAVAPKGLSQSIIQATKTMPQEPVVPARRTPRWIKTGAQFLAMAASIALVFIVFIVPQKNPLDIQDKNLASISADELIWHEVMLLHDELLFDDLEAFNQEF